MKRNSKPIKSRCQVRCLFGLGMAALALVSLPVNAASTTKGKTQTSHHSSQKAAHPAQVTYPPVQPTAQPAYAPTHSAATPVATAPVERDYTFGEVISESMFGDVYAEPSRWQELGYGNLFSKGLFPE